MNHIASDSDDKKRIYKAEARASCKAKSEKAKKTRSFVPYARQSESRVTQPVVQKQKLGLSFLCGKPGYWKKDCMAQGVSQANNKMSSFKRFSNVLDILHVGSLGDCWYRQKSTLLLHTGGTVP